MAVGDVGEVLRGERDERHSAGDDDGRREKREHYGRVVGGSKRSECKSTIQLRRDGVGQPNCAWSRTWALWF